MDYALVSSLQTGNYSHRPRRPLGVTLIAALVLSIAGLNLIRFFLAIRDWDFLSSLPGISPLYLVLSGLVAALIGFSLAWGLWRGKAWAPRYTLLAALVYALYSWIDRTFLSKDSFVHTNWPFALAMTLLILGLVFFSFSRHNSKAFFGEFHEGQS